MTGPDASAPLVAGVDNFRDVGGLPAGDAHTRSGVLFRSGNLAALADDGRDALRRLGVRRVIDLRADEEVAYQPSATEGLEVHTQRVPLLLGSVFALFQDDLTLDEMYRRIVEESSDRVVQVVRGIVEDQPVVVHCTVGKDRTGVTVALALAAAGVDRDAVVADYARTEALLPEARNARVLAMIEAAHPGAVNARDLATRSPAGVMVSLLEGIDRRWGSASDYLLAHGMTDDELRELRRVLVVRPSASL
jgi:protein-tyrosine phosphatase